MLPLQQAKEVRESVIEYIKATFRFKEKDVNKAFYQFIEDKKSGLFKGPYISLKTPFVSATKEESEHIPLDIAPNFPPYCHQLRAFRQLTMKDGHTPEPTLLTTGTGSGKTECFLYPILDYCYRQNKFEHKTGVKVIIMYPMNALASDQAKRLAETIWNDDRLRGKVTAGLFVGEGINAKDFPRIMGPDHIIENRDAILDTVPDILLTNFKMLDYGLMRQRFMPLWRGNIDSETKALRYIVLDELHTYDGAQGTDVANLIRRLKLKLSIPQGGLCPIGTSATIGSGADSKKRLCTYATDIFGETFSEKNVIEEVRIPVTDYITNGVTQLPDIKLLKECEFKSNDTVEGYMKRLCRVWLRNSSISPIEAGEYLRTMQIVGDILQLLQHGVKTIDELQQGLSEINSEYRRIYIQNGAKYGATIVENLLALIAYAKRPLGENKHIPLLYLQVQLWQRELSGILRYMQKEPEFTWRYGLREDDRIAIPMYFCRDCGASGWISRQLQDRSPFASDVTVINKAFMDRDKDVVLLNTELPKHTPIDEYIYDRNEALYVCLADLSELSQNSSDAIRLRVCAKTTENRNGNQKFARHCPECNGDAICEIGGRTSTLSSVAISQVLASDFDHAESNDRKILTFTNSVQDAAHQAGFYEARTFRFLFRQSMQKYLNTLNAPISLAELQKGFKSYWKKELSEEEYFHRFLPADLASHIDLRHNYRDGNGYMQRFKEEFDIRIDWEIASEFGLTAQLGRTLEKTGSSASYFKKEEIQAVFLQMKDWLMANNMQHEAGNQKLFCHYVHGVLQRMRMRGAVDHPYFDKYRNEVLTKWGLNWNRDNRHFLNKTFGGGVHFPKFVGIFAHDGNVEMLDMAILRRSGKHNWYSNYFQEVFNEPWTVNNQMLFNDFIRQLFETLEEIGIINKAPQGGGNYAINPSHIWVSNKVKHIHCDSCQSQLCVATLDLLAEGTHCLDYKCRGTYSEELQPKLNYYQQVYSRSMSPRVHAREHTGLLERSDREQLERDFKTHPHPNSVNVLSATSTLEMGIDIGDLNVMGNTSIPPKPSNFLQRIGRAGRKEGSALVLNYAHTGEPHDSYYFVYPTEMMEGEVNTPGCFLEAKDILRRHFLAYCLDSWTSEDSTHVIPKLVRELHLSNSVLASDTFIINVIISYIKNNKKSLCTLFSLQYEPHVQPALEKLFASLDDESFYQFLLKEFQLLVNKLDYLNDILQQFKQQKSRIQPNDPIRDELELQIKATNRQFKQLLQENIIEYLTNVGLLPNYAFPETGVKLQVNVYSSKKKEDNSSNVVEPKSFELVRSATQGIKELAPGNNFYTQKLRLDISGISTFDWNDSLTDMRFCSKCDAMALKGENGYDLTVCPKCSDPSWGVNTHPILKFTNARSLVKSADAALDDSSEERSRENYIVKKHFLLNHSGTTTSYAMRGVGFGMEFCNTVSLYEVNYGLQMQSGPKVEVNSDQAIPYNGFMTCKYCGKSTHLLAMPNVEHHYKFCNHSTVRIEDNHTEEVFKPLYLYRHLQTEAIKILLPIQIMDANASVEMFKAGIELGMKSYYKSSPEHIRIDSYSEMNQATQKKDHYLVMYDTIPGGTGYLSKLYSTEEFTKLLTFAYNQIHDCECQLEGKDGCYHCILSYGNQYSRTDFSRDQAERLFERLVEHANSWETINGTVGTISQSGVVEDSELEVKFVNALSTMSKANKWSFKKVADSQNYHYELHVENDTDTAIVYHIHPQFALGSPYGVKHYTIADFQVICVAAKIDGNEISELHTIPQWAIYLDGYAYHAKAPNIRFYRDFDKRESIKNSTTHLIYTWTLTWDDILLFESDRDDSLGLNSFTRLMQLLQYPLKGSIKETAYYCIVESDDFMSFGGILYNGQLSLNRDCEETLSDNPTDNELNTVFDDAITYNWNLQKSVSDLDKEDWIGFWRRYNLLQFFSNKHTELSHITSLVNREQIKEFYPGLEDIVDLLIDNNIDFSPEGEGELTNDDEEVIASAMMLLKEQKLAIVPFNDTSTTVFEKHGYKAIQANEFSINLVL
ncbi:MAG: DEAD/DEAH box helicase [Phocaeicola sp.]